MNVAAHVLKSDHLCLDLFDEVAKASHEVADFVLMSGNGLAESDGTLVVDEKRRGLKLFVPEFFQDVPEEHDVLDAFDGRVDFRFCGAERDDLLLLASCMEHACVLAEGEVESAV